MNDAPKVSVIIVHWNVRDLLQANLAQLLPLPRGGREGSASGVVCEVIVVDNGSVDGSVTMIKTDFPRAHLIRNEVNRGFAFAVNQGVRVAKGEVVVLLNPDMLVGEDVLEHVHSMLTRQKDVGVMGIKLMREDGSIVESVRRDPSLLDQVAILLKLPHLFPKVLDRYLMKDFDYGKSQNVEQIRGSFFAFRRDVYENVGPFDQKNFFLWFEEVDFCKRVRQAGLRIWYNAELSATDLIGRSFRQRTVRWKQYHLGRSMARYFSKWHPRWQTAVIYILWPLAVASGCFIDAIGARSKRWK